MAKLLSDIDGKIKHILITSPQIGDIGRVKRTIEVFDRDVAVTVVYPGTPNDYTSGWLGAKAKRLFGKELSHLEQLTTEIYGGRNVTYLAVPNEPWMWPQDLIHVMEDNTIMPSRSLAPYHQRAETQKSITDLVNSSFWKENGFSISQNPTMLHNTDGGDLIAFEDALFAGGGIIAHHLSYDLHVDTNRKIPSRAYERGKNDVINRLKSIDSERDVKVMDIDGQPVGPHLDLIFTPIDKDTVVVADVKTTLEYLNVPPEIQSIPHYQPLIDQLDKFAQKLERKYNRVARVPLVPRLYAPKGMNGRKLSSVRADLKTNYATESSDVFGLMSFNNVLQERYSVNGKKIHRVYIPLYPIPEIVGIPGMDSSKFKDIQIQAVTTYLNLGVEVKPVLFAYIMGFDGALRCSTKVLRRS